MKQIRPICQMPNTIKLSVLFCLLTICATGQEILRPTTESVSPTPAACNGLAVPSTSVPNFYDTAGESTSSNFSSAGAATASIPHKYAQRVISGWQLPSGAYSTLTLKIRSACTELNGYNATACHLQYSTNGGSSWNEAGWGTWIDATQSITLSASQDLSQLRVRICVESSYAPGYDPATERTTFTGYDVRTEGTF